MIETCALAPFSIALLALQLSPRPDMMLVIGRGIGQDGVPPSGQLSKRRCLQEPCN